MSFGVKKKQKNYFKNFLFIIHSLRNQKLNTYQTRASLFDELSFVEI